MPRLTSRESAGRRLGTLDIIREALGSLRRRPGRATLFAIGAALGTAILAASLTLAASAAGQVRAQFDELRSTRLSVTNPDDSGWLSPEAVARVRQLSGVQAVGVQQVAADPVPVSRIAAVYADSAPVPVTVTAATPDSLEAAGVIVRSGRSFDAGMVERRDPVVLLGAALAASLGNPTPDGRTVIFLAGQPVLLVGIVDATHGGDPGILLGAFVPSASSLGSKLHWLSPTVVINTDIGDTDAIASAVPSALFPQGTNSLVVRIPADPQGLRSSVGSELQLLLNVLGIVSLAIGAVVIGTAAVSAVGQRRADIALRRALGTSRAAIYAQIMLETTITGGAGGLVGAVLGQLASVVIADVNSWPLVTSLVLLPVGAGLGLVVGSLAGLYPAAAAALAQPADALRA